MPQLVTQIVLVDQDYGLADGEDKVQAVVEYVNGLTRRYFRLDELPPDTIRSYYADYYMTQVLNGDIPQFVYNSRWNPVIVESVSAALAAIGITDQAALFAEVRDFIERDKPRLDSFMAGYGSRDMDTSRPYMDDLKKIGGGFFQRFTAHPDGYEAGCSQIAVANAAWISTWPNVSWVTEDVFEQELDKLATVITDLPARMQQAQENRPWYYKRIDEALAGAGQKLVRLTGMERDTTAAGVTGTVMHLITDRGHHRVMFGNGEAILLLGDRDEIIARIPARRRDLTAQVSRREARKKFPDLFIRRILAVIRHAPLDLGNLLRRQADIGILLFKVRPQNLGHLLLALVRQGFDVLHDFLKLPIHHHRSGHIRSKRKSQHQRRRFNFAAGVLHEAQR